MSDGYLTRRDVAKGLGATGLVGLAGCSGITGGGSSKTKVAMVYTTEGKGDNGFNDAAYDGMKKAEDDFGIELSESTPSGADQYSTVLRKYAQQDYDIVCGLSFAMQQPMKQVAQDFPDQHFAIEDTIIKLDNVASYRFKEQEACYLAGRMAAKLTTMDFSAGAGSTNSKASVGFMGGKKTPVIERFHAGYRAGVRSVDENMDFRAAYAGSWNSPQKGKSISESMYNKGADIVFPAAGGTGLGTFKAAEEKSRYAIGVDKAQSISAPDYADVILGSVVKHVGQALYLAVKMEVNGNFESQTKKLGLAKDGMALHWGEQLGPKIPDSLHQDIKDTREKIVNGDIQVPSTLD